MFWTSRWSERRWSGAVESNLYAQLQGSCTLGRNMSFQPGPHTNMTPVRKDWYNRENIRDGHCADERPTSDYNQANSKSNIINKSEHLIERVTGIEPALSAWEAVPSGPVTWPDLRRGVSASDRERPLVTGVNGPLMARRTAVRPAPKAVSWPSPVLFDNCRSYRPPRDTLHRSTTTCSVRTCS